MNNAISQYYPTVRIITHENKTIKSDCIMESKLSIYKNAISTTLKIDKFLLLPINSDDKMQNIH